MSTVPGTEVDLPYFDRCRNCGLKIVKVLDGPWLHLSDEEAFRGRLDEDHFFRRGCRAFSYQEGHGWNDALERNWTARP